MFKRGFKKGDAVYLNPEAKFNISKLQRYQKDYPNEIWIVQKYDEDFYGYSIYHPEAGNAHGVNESKLLPANKLGLIKLESKVF